MFVINLNDKFRAKLLALKFDLIPSLLNIDFAKLMRNLKLITDSISKFLNVALSLQFVISILLNSRNMKIFIISKN